MLLVRMKWNILVAFRLLSGWKPTLWYAAENRQNQILELKGLQVVESSSRTADNANVGCEEVVLKS